MKLSVPATSCVEPSHVSWCVRILQMETVDVVHDQCLSFTCTMTTDRIVEYPDLGPGGLKTTFANGAMDLGLESTYRGTSYSS